MYIIYHIQRDNSISRIDNKTQYCVKSTIARAAHNAGGVLAYTDLTGNECNVSNWDIFKVMRSDFKGVFHDVSLEIVPDFAHIHESITTNQPETVLSYDILVKKFLVLSWNDKSCFNLYLPEFLKDCTKAALTKVISMIKDFSQDIKADFDKILWTLEYISNNPTEYRKLEQFRSHLKKCKEWIITNKVYTSVFGSDEAEKLAAGQTMTLNEFRKYTENSHRETFIISHDLPILYKASMQSNVFRIYQCLTTITQRYFNNYYTFLDRDYLLNSVMYLCDAKGKAFLEYRITDLPEDPTNFSDNTIVCFRKPSKTVKFDIEAEKDIIRDLIEKFDNSVNTQENTQENTQTEEKAVEKPVEKPVENVQAATQTDIPENEVKKDLEKPVDFAIDNYYLDSMIWRFEHLIIYYISGYNKNAAIFSPDNFIKLQNENSEAVNNFLTIANILFAAESPAVNWLLSYVTKSVNCDFNTDREKAALICAIQQTEDIYKIDILGLLIPQKADIMQAAPAAANPSGDLPQKEKPKKAATTNTTITIIIYYAIIPAYHTRLTDSFVNMSLEASQNTGARPPNKTTIHTYILYKSILIYINTHISIYQYILIF